MKEDMMVRSVVLAVSLVAAGVAGEKLSFKKYEIESGEVKYRIVGSGVVMGAKMREEGTKRLLFDQYGFRELVEEKSVRKTDIMGSVSIDRSEKRSFRDGTRVKEADLIRKRVMEFEPPGMALMVASARDNLPRMGEEFLVKIGGKKIGRDRVAGYECDIWKLPVVTECIYKGVPLRIVSDAMGIRRTEIAIEAKFGISVDPSMYRLPDFPRENLPGMSANGSGGADMSAFMQIMTEKMERGAGGEISANPSPEDMMVSGTKRMVRRNLDAMSQMKSCMERSFDLASVNRCEKRYSEMMGEPSQPLQSWSESDRRETMREIDEAIAIMRCIQNAKSMKEIESCSNR
jgi:hypothetical protein